MKHYRLLLALTFVGTAVTAMGQGKDDLIQWTSRAGTTLDAKFVKQDGTMVVLKTKDGRLMALPINNLSEDSQAMVDALAGKKPEGEEKSGTESEAKGDTLGEAGSTRYSIPTFTDGLWDGMHAVFDGPEFQALVDARGGVRIFQKQSMLPVEGTRYAYLWPSLLYYPDGELQFRKITMVEAKQKALVQPEKLEFTGETDSGTVFEFTYEFKKEGVSLYGSLKDPSGIEEETALRLGVRFPRYWDIEPNMPEEMQKALVKDSSIEAAPQKGENLRFDFLTRENLNGLEVVKQGLQWVKVKSANCGPRVFKVTAPDLKYGTLRLWNASSSPAYVGFGASLFRVDPEDRSSQARVTIGVE